MKQADFLRTRLTLSWSYDLGFHNAERDGLVLMEDGSCHLRMTYSMRDWGINNPRLGLNGMLSDSTVDLYLLPREKRVTPADNKPIPKAWLNQGGQTAVLVDCEQGVAVALRPFSGRYTERIVPASMDAVPERSAHCDVYWPKAGVMPIPRNVFCLRPPADRSLAADMKEREGEVRKAVTAALTLQGITLAGFGSLRYEVTDAHRSMTTSQLIADVVQDKYTAVHVARNGFTYVRPTERRRFLYTLDQPKRG